MTDLVVVPATFHVVESREQATYPAAVAITAGSVIYRNTAGKWALANATTATLAGTRRAIAVKTVAAGQALTGLYRGTVDYGGGIIAGAFDSNIYLSDTAGGIIADSAGTVSTVIGTVEPGWASGTTPDKLVRVAG